MLTIVQEPSFFVSLSVEKRGWYGVEVIARMWYSSQRGNGYGDVTLLDDTRVRVAVSASVGRKSQEGKEKNIWRVG